MSPSAGWAGVGLTVTSAPVLRNVAEEEEPEGSDEVAGLLLPFDGAGDVGSWSYGKCSTKASQRQGLHLGEEEGSEDRTGQTVPRV